MSYNEDELNSPEWMNESFFLKMLVKIEETSDLKIKELNINPATKKGDHFASIMFRVSIKYSLNLNNVEKSISLIVKTKPIVDGVKKTMLGESNMFDIEIKMYTEVLEEMHRLLRSIGDETLLCARMLYHTNEPTQTLVFEDLTKRDYELPKPPVSFDVSKIVFSKLAKWHACSMVMNENKFDFSPYCDNLFNGVLGGEEIIYLIESQLKEVSKYMFEWNLSDHKEKLDDIIKTIKNRGIEAFNESTWNVLIHGDLHAKNMMMKKSGNQIDDVLLIDFQFPSFASPALDLNYFTYTSTDDECLDRKLELFEIYYTELKKILQKLGYKGKIPTLLDLNIELLKKGFVKVYTSLTYYPLLTLDLEKLSVDVEIILDRNRTEGVDLIEKIYAVPEIQNHIRKYLKECIFEGLI